MIVGREAKNIWGCTVLGWDEERRGDLVGGMKVDCVDKLGQNGAGFTHHLTVWV